MGKKLIEIMDTTLRDGEQTSGVSYTPNEKLTMWHFVRRLQIDHGNAFSGISHYHFRLRKKSENKKCKILDKRAKKMQKYHPKRWFYLDFAYSTCKHVQNTKDFALIPGRVGDILCLCTLKDRLSRILHFLFSFFLRRK